MAGLFRTTSELARLSRRWQEAASAARGVLSGIGDLPANAADSAGSGRLTAVTGFGSNPGDLRMLTFVPDALPPSPALVVALHGCTQSASAYESGAGWSTLAERHGFVLLCPEQTVSNNPKRCFNWFQPADTARDSGEAMSIRQMVEHAIALHGIDRRRIFVTGLSAGGAMACALLASYPDVFAAGGIVAGLPHGAAGNVHEALRAMFEPKARDGRGWGDLVRGATTHDGDWPRLSVWHGDSDRTVVATNAREIVKQWADVHGLPAEPTGHDLVNGHPREVWHDATGREIIESYTIAGMAHGAPIEIGSGDEMAGAAGPFLLDVGISSSFHMARFWGLVPARDGAPAQDRVPARPRQTQPARLVDPARSEPRRAGSARAEPAIPAALDVGRVIKDALRSAGLIKT